MTTDRFARTRGRSWAVAVVVGVMLGIALLTADWEPSALGQGAGPLVQYGQNVRQWHIVARYYTMAGSTRVQVNLVQTVTGTAIKGSSTAGFWLIEQHHINPEFFYNPDNPPDIPRGTPISFHYFIDTIDVNALVRGTGVPVEVVRRTTTYALLEEKRRRQVNEMPIATSIQVGDAVVVAVLVNSSLTKPGRFEERSARVTSVQEGLFTIDLNLEEVSGNSAVHGAPVFVRRGGQWQLAGIFVDHDFSPRPGESAIARLPSLDELVPQEVQKPDQDNDGVPDDEDRCPTIPGDPENDGCPDF